MKKRGLKKIQGQVRLTKAGNAGSAKKPLFWRMPPNADMDRAGDFLLENLHRIRREARPREIFGL
jgi:hypothetical protein